MYRGHPHMPVFELYSKRRKTELKAGQPDVFQYERVSAKLRTQLVHVWRDAIGTKDAYQYDPEVHWAAVHKVLTREKGLQYLVSHARRYRQACEEWFQDVANDEDALDLIEVVAVLIDGVLCRLDDHGRKMRNIELSAAAALAEMNYRFRENDLGFQYENGVLVRLDSQYVHANITKPALALLCAEPFGKANDDFMNAHKHYRAGDHKACVVACQR